jgi:hypothetical protein
MCNASQYVLLWIGNNLVECPLRPHPGEEKGGIVAEAVKGAIIIHISPFYWPCILHAETRTFFSPGIFVYQAVFLNGSCITLIIVSAACRLAHV